MKPSYTVCSARPNKVYSLSPSRTAPGGCPEAGWPPGWPGADRVRPGKETASTALDASATIWRFFASQPAHPAKEAR